MSILKQGKSLLYSVADSFNITTTYWDSILHWLQSLFYQQEMELCILGIPSAGKTSLINAITTGSYQEDMIPTLGLNMRKVKRGNVSIKMWDLGGQERVRPMSERYCRGVQAILYVVDVADAECIPISRRELHHLLSKPSLVGIPLLLLGNKIDMPNALSHQTLIDFMRVDSIKDREVCCHMISCKEKLNIDIVIHWLIKHSNTRQLPRIRIRIRIPTFFH